MKAIVLTYDRNQHVAHHMVARYRKLWPDHSFSFRIPYQSLTSIPEGFAVSYVRTEPPIVDTVRTLLAEISDEEWIFWSIDDYFPIRLDLPWIRRLIDRLHDPEASDVSGFNFCASYKKKRYWRNGQLRQKRHVRLFGERFVEVPDYDQMWFPQFFRGRVLKTFFGRLENPRDHAKELDYQLRRLTKPAADRLLMSSSDHAIFAESTIRSGYTHDFVGSATEMGIPFDRTRVATETSQWKRSGRMGLGDRWEKFLRK